MKKHILLLSIPLILLQWACSSCKEEKDIWEDFPEHQEKTEDNTKGKEGTTEVQDEEKPEVKVTSLFTEEEMKRANTAAEADYMTQEEKEMLKMCNLARIDGKRFAQEYLQPYFKGKTSEYIESLYRDLEGIKNKTLLLPAKELYGTASNHAEDMGTNHFFSHNSSNGATSSDRLRGIIPNAIATAENIAAKSSATNAALEFLVQLLVDENLENLGHRKAILGLQSKEYNRIGVVIRKYDGWKYKYFCVQDFAHVR